MRLLTKLLLHGIDYHGIVVNFSGDHPNHTSLRLYVLVPAGPTSITASTVANLLEASDVNLLENPPFTKHLMGICDDKNHIVTK